VFSRQDFERLLTIPANPVLSVYLHTDPAQDPKGSFRIWVKDALKALEGRVEGSEQKRFRELADRVNTQMREFRPQGKSWIAFLGSDLYEAYDLRVPVDNEVQWGRLNLSQLEWLLEEYRPYTVVLADSEKLRFFVIAMNEIQEINDRALELDTSEWRRKELSPPSQPRGSVVRGSVRGGTERDAFTERLKVQTERFWREATAVLRHLREVHRAEELVLGGPKAVRERFLQTLGAEANRVIGQISLPLEASPAEVLSQSLELIQSHEREREKRVVEELLRRASTSDRAGVGLLPTLKALQEGRVEKVVVIRRLEATLHECESCGYVFDREVEECVNCSFSQARRASLRGLLPVLIRRHGAKLEIVRGPAAKTLAPHGGMGALWRY
jgi:predicted Zn-ribbon and HTH transcriptional regulator